MVKRLVSGLGMEGERGQKGFAPPLYKGGDYEHSSLSPFKHTQWVGSSIWGRTGFFIGLCTYLPIRAQQRGPRKQQPEKLSWPTCTFCSSSIFHICAHMHVCMHVFCMHVYGACTYMHMHVEARGCQESSLYSVRQGPSQTQNSQIWLVFYC